MSRFLAIDIDSHGLIAVSGTARAGVVKVENVLAWTDGFPPFTPETAAALGTQLKERLKSAGIAPAPVLLSIGRDRIILKELRYPPVPPADEPNIVRFQAMKELTEAADEVVIDYVPYATHPGPDRRSLAVIVDRDVVKAAHFLCGAAGWKLAAITPRPFAAAALVEQAVTAGTVSASADEAVGLLLLGPHGGEFTVVRGGDVLFTRTVPASVITSNQSLAGEMKRNLAVFSSQYPTTLLTAILIPEVAGAGRSGSLDGVLEVPIVDFDPLEGTTAEVPAALHGRFAAPIGLLTARAHAETLPINFVSPRQPKPTADPVRRQLLVGGILGGLLLVFGIGFGVLELDAAGRRMQQLTIEKMDLEAERAQLESDAKRVRLVEEWEDRPPIWLDELYDLADRFERLEDTRVTSMTASTFQPDKAGKRPASGKLEIKLGTRDPDAVTDLVSAINRDNTAKDKFYASVQKTTGGLASGGTPFNQLFTITILVNRREPEKYTRTVDAKVPVRTAAPRLGPAIPQNSEQPTRSPNPFLSRP